MPQQLVPLTACCASCLPNLCASQLARHGPCPLLFLDISANRALTDAGVAALLALCPRLRTLYAAGSRLGSASLAALAGRQPQAAEADAQQQREEQRARRPPHRSGGGCDADGAADATQGLRLSPGSPSAGVAGAGAGAGGAVDACAAACPLLERLDVSGCSVKGSALRRALRCLPSLADLRLNGSSCLHAALDPLLPADGASGSSGKAAAAAASLARLTRLEALDADDLSARHAHALLAACTSLRHLALSGKQLAAEQLDRQQHAAAHASGSDGSSGSAALPSLVHLEVGWGTGGSFLAHLAERHAPHLASLTVHPGAAVSDWLLQRLAPACPCLRRLQLRGANVSDAGEDGGQDAAQRLLLQQSARLGEAPIAAPSLSPPTPAAPAGVSSVLSHCTQLTSLQLLGCTGPLTDALAGGLARRPPAFRLREVEIGWGAAALTDAGLAALTVGDRAALRVLVLKGCSALTDGGVWDALLAHAPTLECLALESCGAQPALGKAAAPAHPPLSTAAALEALERSGGCPRLLALTIRECTAPWSAADAARLRAACPELQSMDLG